MGNGLNEKKKITSLILNLNVFLRISNWQYQVKEAEIKEHSAVVLWIPTVIHLLPLGIHPAPSFIHRVRWIESVAELLFFCLLSRSACISSYSSHSCCIWLIWRPVPCCCLCGIHSWSRKVWFRDGNCNCTSFTFNSSCFGRIGTLGFAKIAGCAWYD